MDDTKKMFQKIINGQSAMKSELLGEIKKAHGRIDSLVKETRDGFKRVDQRIGKLDRKLTKRIDKIGLVVARLEDDTPTIEEFDELEKKSQNWNKNQWLYKLQNYGLEI